MSLTHKEYADSLREYAKWVEKHPEIRLPYNIEEINHWCYSKEEMQTFITAFGKCEKIYKDTTFTTRKRFGHIVFEAHLSRDQVCEKKVVGTKVIPEEVIPARTIPAHEEPIYEYDCRPVLGESPKLKGKED